MINFCVQRAKLISCFSEIFFETNYTSLTSRGDFKNLKFGIALYESSVFVYLGEKFYKERMDKECARISVLIEIVLQELDDFDFEIEESL